MDQKKLAEALRNYRPEGRTYDSTMKNVKAILDQLAESGQLGLGDDKNLGGWALEVRTKILFTRMGFNVVGGRAGHEDFEIKPSPELQPCEPLVVEVKAARHPNVGREDLRQLDDWVFDLSGEEKARKNGLGGGVDTLAMMSNGILSSTHRHPSPCKGVMLFNGPIGTDFESRPAICFNENEREFIEKRGFCIIAFCVLLEYERCISSDQSMQTVFWERVHRTVGILEGPN